MRRILFILNLLTISGLSQGDFAGTARNDTERTFPDFFLFGAASAAYQIEGGWDADGKTWSIWDHLVRTDPDAVANRANGDVACDSYNLYMRDVAMLRDLEANFYRFSISWPRILPEGLSHLVNPAGINYYNNVINELLYYNITPIVTIYHWDMPQRLQLLGGWANPHSVDWFGDYARVLYENFGDRVRTWVTINEPTQICNYAYGNTRLVPRLDDTGFGEYLCSKYVLLSHARAYHIYDEEFRPSQNGMVGISLSGMWGEPASDSEADIAAASLHNQFEFGLYMQPIYGETGDFPEVVKERIAQRSQQQGFVRSRLPTMTQEEIDYIRGTSDYLGLNHYTTIYVYSNETLDESNYRIPSFDHDLFVGTFRDDAWPQALSSWLREVPWGLFNMLMYIRDNNNNPMVYITENGMSTTAGLSDDDRIRYYRNYLSAVLDAIDVGSNVMAYTAWSLMDNFQWLQGYEERFGLFEVDFDVAERTRTPRKSAFVFKDIIRSRTIDWSYNPDPFSEQLGIYDSVAVVSNANEYNDGQASEFSSSSQVKFTSVFMYSTAMSALYVFFIFI